MTNIPISIIVPVYNAEKYLYRCIDSVLSQSFTDFELILVDDGSKDCSAQICEDYAKKDHRIRVIHQPNSGVSAARNRGIERAKGEYISFIDADDWIEQNMYNLLLEKAFTMDADYVYCDYFQENGFSSVRKETAKCFPDNSISTKRNILGRWFLPAWSSIIKRTIISQNKIYFSHRLAYNEDFHFIARCLVFCQQIHKIDLPLYHYDESNTSSALHKNQSRQGEDEYTSQIDIVSYYSKYNLYKTFKKQLNHRLIRCIFFYRSTQREKSYESSITIYDLITCPHIGIRGKLYLAKLLFWP